jgi:hypothetical protein
MPARHGRLSGLHVVVIGDPRFGVSSFRILGIAETILPMEDANAVGAASAAML